MDVSDRAVPRPNLRFGRRQFPILSGTWNPFGIPTFLQSQLTQKAKMSTVFFITVGIFAFAGFVSGLTREGRSPLARSPVF